MYISVWYVWCLCVLCVYKCVWYGACVWCMSVCIVCFVYKCPIQCGVQYFCVVCVFNVSHHSAYGNKKIIALLGSKYSIEQVKLE